MTMDLKEIIKWFIPCFHILLYLNKKMNTRLTMVFLCLFFNLFPVHGAKVNSVVQLDLSSNSINDTKKLVNFDDVSKFNQSEGIEKRDAKNLGFSSDDTSVGRTFGRPLKKMMGALLPVLFQIGAASTWAVVAAMVGVKTLLVTLAILKLLLMAGAAKLGALYASKDHQSHQGWEPHQKEIHLHIHNGHVSTDEHISSWNRDSLPLGVNKNINVAVDPYSAGPQTINTPYGSYIKID
ncbi:uncharacterized protein LOC113511512 [Galleria mellonella]|uniref:Uncharacterized protein LOC113511512 n=1 Tax=Galleria mellonella TaxID=7137 RepID=A0ABM3MS74_GALME|nr:uncharacterized protein LOC113511512 [Galleria mellonella]